MDNETTIREAIAQAMERHILLKIRYIDKHNKESVRLVRPDSVKGSVLFAYCMLRQDERAFVISRIQEACLTDQPAPIPVETEPDRKGDTCDLNDLDFISKRRKRMRKADVEDFVSTVKWLSYTDFF